MSSSTQPPLPVGSQGQAISVISNKYRLSRRLGGGSFGDIYLGEYIPTSEKVAIKFEKHGARCPQLRHEYKVYRELQHCAGFGKVHYFGQHDCFNVMVMELLGYSLEDLFNKCGRRFSLRTVLQLADQVLERVEIMHNRHLIHRDIKVRVCECLRAGLDWWGGESEECARMCECLRVGLVGLGRVNECARQDGCVLSVMVCLVLSSLVRISSVLSFPLFLPLASKHTFTLPSFLPPFPLSSK